MALIHTKGGLDKAIDRLNQAIRIKACYHGAGYLFARYARVLQSQYLPEAHYNLGDAFYKQNMYPQAIAEYQKVLRIKPDFPWAHTALGRAYQSNLQYVEAIAEFRKAIETGDPWGANNLGFMYQSGWGLTKDDHEAVRLYRQAIDGNNTLAMLNVAYHYCPVKSRRESVGWHFRRNWRPGRWPEGRIKWAFSRKA